MDFKPETLRARFDELSKQRAKIDKELDPARAELNDIAAGKSKDTYATVQSREAKLRDKIRDLQGKLAPIENERAAVARALGGQTGKPQTLK